MFTLESGKTYTVKLTIKNTSTRGGAPVAATLKVGISADAGGAVLIAAQEAPQEFLAGQSRVLPYSLNVPSSASGLSGTVAASVKDPAGNTLASNSEGVTIASPALSLTQIAATFGMESPEFRAAATAAYIAQTGGVVPVVGMTVGGQITLSIEYYTSKRYPNQIQAAKNPETAVAMAMARVYFGDSAAAAIEQYRANPAGDPGLTVIGKAVLKAAVAASPW